MERGFLLLMVGGSLETFSIFVGGGRDAEGGLRTYFFHNYFMQHSQSILLFTIYRIFSTLLLVFVLLIFVLHETNLDGRRRQKMRIRNAPEPVELRPHFDGVLAEVHGSCEKEVESETENHAVTLSHDASDVTQKRKETRQRERNWKIKAERQKKCGSDAGCKLWVKRLDQGKKMLVKCNFDV